MAKTKKQTIRVGILDTLIDVPDTDKGGVGLPIPERKPIILGQLADSWQNGELKKYLADQTNNFKGKKRYDFLYSVMSAAKNLYNDED